MERAWFAAVTDHEAAALSAATATPRTTWPALTLASAVVVGSGVEVFSARDARWAAWRDGSWFCPACLGESGGRWMLRWRLGWVFACLRHQCLLAATCPECGGVPRAGAHPLRLVPTPGRCYSRPPGGDVAETRGQGCGFPLADTPVDVVPEDDPALQAARHVEDALTGWLPARYAASGLGPVAVFADLRLLAALALRPPWLPDLRRTASPALRRVWDHHAATTPARRTRPGSLERVGPQRPDQAAAALSVAVDALTHPDRNHAACNVRWIVDPAHDWQAARSPRPPPVAGSQRPARCSLSSSPPRCDRHPG